MERHEINDVAPTSLNHLIGQRSVVDQVKVALDAAFADGKKLDDCLLVGGSGLGKTQVAKVIAAELASRCHEALGQAVQSNADNRTPPVKDEGQKSCSSIRWEVETQPAIEEQLMSKKSSGRKRRSRERLFVSCLRDFLSPSFFRQVYQTISRGRKRRWEIQPLLYVLLCMTWCLGDSQPERFETARACYVALHPKRRRPGKTVQGFDKALLALPCSVLHTVAHLFRKQILARFGSLMTTDGWIVLGCDGSRIRTPRTVELEKRLGNSGVDKNSKCKTPRIWLTALVHLQSGMPWSWRVGKGDSSERLHLLRLIPTLPLRALIVTDATCWRRNWRRMGIDFS